MILDTGATNTTIDTNALYLLGYDLKDNIGSVEIETANGMIETEVFEIETFTSLSLTKGNFQFKFMISYPTALFQTTMDFLDLIFLKEQNFALTPKKTPLHCRNEKYYHQQYDIKH